MALAFLVAAALVVGTANSETKAPPFNKSQIPGSWFGHDTCLIELLRITFETNGTGRIAYKLGDSPATVFPIRSWQLTNGKVQCVIPAEQVKLSITAFSCFLKCEFTWAGAKRNFHLVREDQLLAEIEKMRTSAGENHWRGDGRIHTCKR